MKEEYIQALENFTKITNEIFSLITSILESSITDKEKVKILKGTFYTLKIK